MDDPRKPEDGAELHATVEGEDVAIGLIPCSSWSWGLERMIGNASIESRYADFKGAWILAEGERLGVELSRGPLVRLERRSQTPAPLDESFLWPGRDLHRQAK